MYKRQMQTNSDSTSLFHLVETVKNQLSFLFFNPFSPIGDIQLIIVRIFFQQNLNQASCICIFYGIFQYIFCLLYTSNMTDLSEWGFKCISNPVGIVLLIIGVLLIQAKRIEAKERIQVGIGLVAIKKTVKP